MNSVIIEILSFPSFRVKACTIFICCWLDISAWKKNFYPASNIVVLVVLMHLLLYYVSLVSGMDCLHWKPYFYVTHMILETWLTSCVTSFSVWPSLNIEDGKDQKTPKCLLIAMAVISPEILSGSFSWLIIRFKKIQICWAFHVRNQTVKDGPCMSWDS